MTSSRTTLALAALVLAGPLAACAGGSSTPAATVTLTAAPTTGTTTATAPAATTTSEAAVTQTVTETATATQRSTTHRPTVTQTVTETATAAPAPATQTATESATSSTPVLGLAASRPSGRGLGKVKPSRVYYGGDPTGDAMNITWNSWGGPTAEGQGYGYWMGKDQSVSQAVKVPMKIRAWDLTSCDGRLAYSKVAWWFPTKGDADPGTSAQSYDLCEKS